MSDYSYTATYYGFDPRLITPYIYRIVAKCGGDPVYYVCKFNRLAAGALHMSFTDGVVYVDAVEPPFTTAAMRIPSRTFHLDTARFIIMMLIPLECMVSLCDEVLPYSFIARARLRAGV